MTHFHIARRTTKPPARRCKWANCVELTRHKTQLCPDHRHRGQSWNH